MTPVIFYIYLGAGVTVEVRGMWESKHYGEDALRNAGDLIARKMGGDFSHFEFEEQV